MDLEVSLGFKSCGCSALLLPQPGKGEWLETACHCHWFHQVVANAGIFLSSPAHPFMQMTWYHRLMQAWPPSKQFCMTICPCLLWPASYKPCFKGFPFPK